MTHKMHFLTAIAIAAGALLSSATGCELIASVDRSKIAGTGGNTGGTGGTGGTGTGGTNTGGTGTGGQTGGTGGTMPMCAAGVMSCTMDSDCPATSGECVLRKCDMGCCTTENAADGTETTAGQTAGDCKVQVCDGSGGTKIINDDDPQDDSNDCTQDTCNNGTNVHTEIAGTCDDNNGTVCANPAGPKKGTCVECNVDADCTTAGEVCDPVNGTNTCVPSSCADGVKNGSETGQDCGGPVCGDCPNGQGCMNAGDCQSNFCSGTTCAACTNDTNCAAGEFCGTALVGTQGVCQADRADGLTCTLDSQCANGNCVDGVCCNTACGGTCQACTAAIKGQGLDGTCGPIAIGTDPQNECTNQGADTCGDNGFCDGAGACQKFAAGTVCRPANGACDTQEVCAGGGAACPADAFLPSSNMCRAAAAGGCDVAEFCTGTGPNCPADTFQPSSTVCRVAAAGGCDVAENCTGTSAACPADEFAPSSTICRAAVPGGCDVAETCTGSSAACPADTFQPSGTVCRAAVPGGCDVQETCSGLSNACPADTFQPSGTVCRAAVPGGCDVQETCSGSSNACPADTFQPSGTVCRAAVPGGCDVAETCSGSSNACPADVFQPNTTVCRAAVPGGCDVAENCTGSSNACPADVFQPSGTVCRAYAGTCDLAETCSGSSNACPADAFVSQGGTDTGACEGNNACTGAGTGAANCLLANGQPCTMNSECASNNCNIGDAGSGVCQ